MSRELANAVQETVIYMFLALKALRFWRRDPPVTKPKELVHFFETRSKFVAQTTLYGYVKARALCCVDGNDIRISFCYP